MENGPFKPLLDRALMKAFNKEKIDKQSQALTRLVDYSTQVFARCWQSRQDSGYYHNGFFLLYRHALEMTDAIQVLISESCFGPCIPLLRSLFESVLSMEFISRKDFENRSLALLTYYFNKQLDQLESRDPSTEKGKNLIRKIRNDRFVPFVLPELKADYETESSERRELLKSDEFAHLNSEHKRLKKERNLRFWCQLCDTGDKAISRFEQLVNHLERTSEYEFHYRTWSEVSHARNFSRLLTEDTEGQQFHERMRSVHVYEDPGVSAATYMYQGVELLLAKYRPDEISVYENWFDRTIKSALQTG